MSGNRNLSTADIYDGVRWQLSVDDVDEVVAICRAAGLGFDVITEEGGATHRSQIATVRSPNGVLVWFEGPNDLE